MGKALMGTHAVPRTIELLEEIRALRRRVAELERALSEAEGHLQVAGPGSDAGDEPPTPASTAGDESRHDMVLERAQPVS